MKTLRTLTGVALEKIERDAARAELKDAWANSEQLTKQLAAAKAEGRKEAFREVIRYELRAFHGRSLTLRFCEDKLAEGGAI